jgi:hypothetical protein
MTSSGRLRSTITMAIGVIALLCAALGLLYNINSLMVALTGGFDELVVEHNLSRFYPAFYIMSATCIAFYLLLSWYGLQLLRLRSSAVWPFSVLMIVEVVYFFAIGAFAPHVAELGLSIGGAFGVANGGLMVQFLILFPVWGPACAIWAGRRIAWDARAGLAPNGRTPQKWA